MNSKYQKTKPGKNKTVVYGYVGRWEDGTIGWFLPEHAGYSIEPINPTAREYANPKGERFELCKITVEVVKGAKGRWINKKKEAK